MEWIDAAKGLAILAVVLGHVIPDHRPLYWWHIPCFYFLSGYTFRFEGTFQEFAWRRSARLLVPYCIWIVLLSIPPLVTLVQHPVGLGAEHFFLVRLYGGEKFAPPLSTYWFLSSLFFTGLVFFWLSSRLKPAALALAMIVSYVLAIVRQYLLPNPTFPLEIDSVLIALPFFYLGFQFKKLNEAAQRRVIMVLSLAFLGVLLAFVDQVPIPNVDIKNAEYGLPGISITVALAGTGFCCGIARISGIAQNGLAAVGKASLTIMLLHQAVILAIDSHVSVSWPVVFVCASLLPFGFHLLISRYPLPRRLLLGQTR